MSVCPFIYSLVISFFSASDSEIELQRIEFVGPQIGSELRDQGGLGMLVALGMILLYVAFRFQYKFALGAVAALAHDVVIILGLFSLLAWDFDLTVLFCRQPPTYLCHFIPSYLPVTNQRFGPAVGASAAIILLL